MVSKLGTCHEAMEGENLFSVQKLLKRKTSQFIWTLNRTKFLAYQEYQSESG